MSSSGPLRWRRVGEWDLSDQQQVRFIADGREVQYKIIRAGTAGQPTFALYTRRDNGMEECCCVSNLLREVKSHARTMEEAPE